MNLALVYDPDCPKMRPDAYSQTYRDMMLALYKKFDVQEIYESCLAKDIDADIIFFFDIHSSHHIEIDGIKNHPAWKYEYFNDPHQHESTGVYGNKTRVHKLGAEQRCHRAIDRGVNFIICPYTNNYYKYLSPYLPDGMLLWFPVAPRQRVDGGMLNTRIQEVLANGHTWQGETGFRPYKFRSWAHQQSCVLTVPHFVQNKQTQNGESFQDLLSKYAGALALCDTHAVPKYLEIPLSGCVTFAQYQYDYEQMGFKDMESCIYVTKANFHDRINAFKNDIESYQSIADKGKTVAMNWTADKFADFVFNHASSL